MRKKRLLLRFTIPLMLLLTCSIGFAQNKVITGKITDSKDGSPLVGVTVLVKGTRTGVQTQTDGSFRLEVPNSASALVVSYIGYTTRELSIGAGNFEIGLVSSANSTLNDVVVIGYGSVRQKDLTGSISTVNAKDFQQGAAVT